MLLLPPGLLICGAATPGPCCQVMWLPEPVALMMATVCKFTVLAEPLTSTSAHVPFRVTWKYEQNHLAANVTLFVCHCPAVGGADSMVISSARPLTLRTGIRIGCATSLMLSA